MGLPIDQLPPPPLDSSRHARKKEVVQRRLRLAPPPTDDGVESRDRRFESPSPTSPGREAVFAPPTATVTTPSSTTGLVVLSPPGGGVVRLGPHRRFWGCGRSSRCSGPEEVSESGQ